MTELEERLASDDSAEIRREIADRLNSITTRLRQCMADQLQTKEAFARLTILASASEMAQKLMEDAGYAEKIASRGSPHP